MVKLPIFFFMFTFSNCLAKYHSQCGQDKFINETFFKNLTNGIFVDVGAYDGIKLSNTYFYEKELGWTGICIEPIPQVFKKLEKVRSCLCIQACASIEHGIYKDFIHVKGGAEMLSGLVETYDQKHLEFMNECLRKSKGKREGKTEKIRVPCYNLNRILDEAGITHINLLSIDTEGGELRILKDLDFSKFHVDVITVEDNYGNEEFIPYMESQGFEFVKRLKIDLVFVNKKTNIKTNM